MDGKLYQETALKRFKTSTLNKKPSPFPLKTPFVISVCYLLACFFAKLSRLVGDFGQRSFKVYENTHAILHGESGKIRVLYDPSFGVSCIAIATPLAKLPKSGYSVDNLLIANRTNKFKGLKAWFSKIGYECPPVLYHPHRPTPDSNCYKLCNPFGLLAFWFALRYQEWVFAQCFNTNSRRFRTMQFH